MGLRDAARGAIRKVGLRLITAQVTRYAGDAASGKLGPVALARYELWRGKKTWTGMALMVAGVGAAALGYNDVAEWTAVAGGFLATVGLIDRGYRTDIPGEVAQNGLYRFLASHGGLVGGILVTASTWLSGAPDCGWCLVVDKVVLVLGAVAVQVKLIDPAWRAKPPILR
jgi:hypothetical protein